MSVFNNDANIFVLVFAKRLKSRFDDIIGEELDLDLFQAKS